VRYSLRVLEHEGLIGPSVHGAITTDKTKQFVQALGGRIDTLDMKVEEIKRLSGEI
jgi:predicted transcriptional regulator